MTKVRSQAEAKNQAIAQVVRAIPRGRVMAYSRVAILSGMPGAARRVGKALRELKGVPWWRVVRADLRLVEHLSTEQARRLQREGVAISRGRVGTQHRATLGEVAARLEER